MKISTKIEIIVGLLSLFLWLPMSMYVTFSMLKLLPVDRLVWFFFWCTVPMAFLSSVLTSIAKGIKSEED